MSEPAAENVTTPDDDSGFRSKRNDAPAAPPRVALDEPVPVPATNSNRTNNNSDPSRMADRNLPDPADDRSARPRKKGPSMLDDQGRDRDQDRNRNRDRNQDDNQTGDTPSLVDEPLPEPLGNPPSIPVAKRPTPIVDAGPSPSFPDDDDVIRTTDTERLTQPDEINKDVMRERDRQPVPLPTAEIRIDPARPIDDGDTIRIPSGPPARLSNDVPPLSDTPHEHDVIRDTMPKAARNAGPDRSDRPGSDRPGSDRPGPDRMDSDRPNRPDGPGIDDEPIPRPRPNRLMDEVDFVEGPRSGDGAKVDITKSAPQTALLGEPLVYQILVRNSGSAKAAQVIVEDHIPEGMDLEGTIPQAELREARLIWKLGMLAAGEQRKILVKVTPRREGKIGTVAMVRFASSGFTETVVGAPKLRIELTGPDQVMLGSSATFRFRVTNTGRMDARGVVIRSKLPPELHFPEGDVLTYEVGLLPAGKSDEVSLKLMAARQGPAILRALVTSDGATNIEAEQHLDIIGANFKLTRTGPKRLYMGKLGVWENQIFNKDDRPVMNLTIEEKVPVGMRFVEATKGGRYDPDKRLITWNLRRIEPGETIAVNASLTVTSRGSQTTSVKAFDSTAMAMLDFVANGQGVSGLSIDISDIETPQVVGDRFTVKVRVANRGSDSANNVRASVVIPPNLEFITATGRRDFQLKDNLVEFDSTVIDSQQEQNVELTFRAKAPGETRLQVLVGSDRYPEPLRAEEATTIVSTDE